MSRTALLQTLKKYEKELEGESLERSEVGTMIINDLNRTGFQFSKYHKSVLIIKLYLFILEKAFDALPLPYFQGMTEIAAIMIEAYFQDAAGEFKSTYSDLSAPATPKPESAGAASKPEKTADKIKMEDISADEKKAFQEFLQTNAELFGRFTKSLINVLDQKYLFLSKDGFKNYKEGNEVFVSMMKVNCNKQLNEESAIKYMNHTLTLFARISYNSEVAFKFLNLVLNSDAYMVFCILAHYIDKIDQFDTSGPEAMSSNKNQIMVTSVEEDDIKEILRLHELFLKRKKDIHKKMPSTNAGLFLGAAIGCALIGIGIAFWKSANSNK